MAPESELSVIAVFDFDGTLTTHDTFIRFSAWRRSKIRFAADLFVTLPLVALYAMRLAANDVPKMALFSRIFTGMRAEEFHQRAIGFAHEEVPRLIRPEGLERLRFHRNSGHTVVIVSASIDQWIVPWAKEQGVEGVIASRAEVREGRLTGRLDGPNCHGEEKLRRLLERFPNRESYVMFAYGDSRGDRALLDAADHPYYRRFS